MVINLKINETMKKLFYTFGAALVMLASVSCEKKDNSAKEEPSRDEKVNMTFTAAANSAAERTTVTDGTTVVWSDGDAIRVFANGETSGDVCDMTSEAGKTYATFEGQCAKQGPWTAIYPAFDGATYSDGAITFTMPAEQTYAENTFAQGAMPCVAYSETTEFTFNHSFGVLKLSLKLASGKTGSVKSITVTTKGTEKLNGTFTVTPKTSATAAKSGTDGTNAITLNCVTGEYEEGVELSEIAKDFWIVVPAGAFANGFDVEITTIDDKIATLSTENDNTIKVGEIKPMPEKEIMFTAGYAAVKTEAGIPGNKVKWVQLWENGPKWAEYNVGATSVEGVGFHYRWGGIIDNGDDYVEGYDENPLSAHDAAKNLWGDKWKMPTKEDILHLVGGVAVEGEDGTVRAKSVYLDSSESGYGIAGMLCTGIEEGYKDNSVFFPAAGLCSEKETGVVGVGYVGGYWASSINYSGMDCDFAYAIYILPAEIKRMSLLRNWWFSVRAVLAE